MKKYKFTNPKAVLLEVIKSFLNDDYNEFICCSIDDLFRDDEISQRTRNKTMDFLHSQKPSPDINTEFTKHEFWWNGNCWWNSYGVKDEGKRFEKAMTEKKRFLTHIIAKL